MTGARTSLSAAGLAVLAVVWGCESKAPTRPTPLGRPAVHEPGPPPAPSIQRIEVLGPGELPPGASGQYEARAHLSDGTFKNVTSDAIWTVHSTTCVSCPSAGDPAIAIVGPGQVSALGRGTGQVHAAYTWMSDGLDVHVVLPGTFVLRGQVTTGSNPPQGVPGATVNARPGEGLSTTTDAWGSFRLFGVAADTTLRVSKAGYATDEQRLSIAGHHEVTVSLSATAAIPALSGVYTMTLEAGEDCEAAVRSAIGVRRYTATITQDGAQARVVLSGATMATRVPVFPGSGTGDSFDGLVDLHDLFATLDDFDHWDCSGRYPSVVEALGGGRHLTVVGRLTLRHGSQMRGSLDGNLSVYDKPFDQISCGPPEPVAACYSASHRVTLTR